MLKYTDTEIVFREIPDEITLAINISGCPIHCPDCHSKELWDDIGEKLTEETVKDLIDKNPGITCVSFMGGDNDPKEILILAGIIKIYYPNIKVAWYSGRKTVSVSAIHLLCLDYIKTGPFIKEKGPLDNPNTNQHLYMKEENKYVDITYKFWTNGT